MTTSPSRGECERQLLWVPSADRVAASRMAHYMDWVNARRPDRLLTYDELWRWSVDDLDGFWQSIWDYFDIVASAPPGVALANARMPGARWFPGARLNWAENVLAHASGDRPAIVSLREDAVATELSWAELVARVASLAAELRA